MSEQEQDQCPVCYNYIEYEEGVAYCFICDAYFHKIDDEVESELLDFINEQP